MPNSTECIQTWTICTSQLWQTSLNWGQNVAFKRITTGSPFFPPPQIPCPSLARFTFCHWFIVIPLHYLSAWNRLDTMMPCERHDWRSKASHSEATSFWIPNQVLEYTLPAKGLIRSYTRFRIQSCRAWRQSCHPGRIQAHSPSHFRSLVQPDLLPAEDQTGPTYPETWMSKALAYCH